MLTQNKLKDILHYDPKTGVFTRKRTKKETGWDDGRGYLRAFVNGCTYRCHHLAWLYMNGKMPKQIDHVNGRPDDNRISNIREATTTLNNQNRRGPNAANPCGYMGVHYHEKRGVWVAQISINSKTKYIGSFHCAKEAHENYLKAKREFHAGCTI